MFRICDVRRSSAGRVEIGVRRRWTGRAAVQRDIDLCLIHLGGTRVAGILLTMDAEQGVKALQLIEPTTAVPIHYDDYTVFKSPLDDFKAAAAAASLRTEIRYVGRGDTHRFEVPDRSTR